MRCSTCFPTPLICCMARRGTENQVDSDSDRGGEMAKKKTDRGITEVARTIGSTLGNAVVQASRVVEGVKAAAKAGAETYSKKTFRPKARGTAKPARKAAAKKRTARPKG